MSKVKSKSKKRDHLTLDGSVADMLRVLAKDANVTPSCFVLDLINRKPSAVRPDEVMSYKDEQDSNFEAELLAVCSSVENL